MVLHLGGDDAVARVDVGHRPRERHEVDGLGRVADEDDVLDGRRVDERRHLAARLLVGVGRFHAEGVDSPVDVRVVALVVVHERLNHRARLLRGGGVVEVDQRLAVHLSLQDGKIVADTRKVVHVGSFAPD